VLCPPTFNVTLRLRNWTFNVTLRLPNWHQQTDKTLDLQLTDSQRTHLVFLTHLTFDPITQGRRTSDDRSSIGNVSAL